MPDVRKEIEIVYKKGGRILKHPSGVEVWESLEEIEARVAKVKHDKDDTSTVDDEAAIVEIMKIK